MSKGKKMVKEHKVSVAVFVLVCMCTAVIAYMLQSPKATAETTEAISHGYAIGNSIPEEDEEAAKGTESNPFVIVEIVSRIELAEFGYLIDGCEPVDVDLMSYNNDGKLMDLNSNNAATVTQGAVEKFDLDPKTDNPDIWTYVTWTTKQEKGYYERVEAGTGLFVQKMDTAGNVIEGFDKSDKGDFIWVTDSSTEYTEEEADLNAPFVGDRIYTTRTDHYYINYNKYTYTNKNYFIERVLGVDKSEVADFHVVYKAIEPKELNNHLEWIDRADLFYINPKSHRSALVNIWKEYNKEGYKSGTYTTVNEAYFEGDQDLSWEAVMRIFNKVVVEDDFAPIIIDNNTYQNYIPKSTFKQISPYQFGYDEWGIETSYLSGTCSGSSNNMWKLCLMLRTMDPEMFYNLYLNDNTADGGEAQTVEIASDTVDGKTTGVYKRQKGTLKGQSGYEVSYWGAYTFMPTKLDGSQAGQSDWATGECWDTYKTNPVLENGGITVSDRVYAYNGDNSLADQFVDDSKITDSQYTDALFDWLDNGSTSASPATALQFLLAEKNKDNSQIKSPITVLDLEPCDEFTLTVAQIRRMLPSYKGSIILKQQTTAEFNCRIEDINSEYDLIYMGLNYGKYNSASVRISLGNSGSVTKTLPVYNDGNLNGKIYLHVGDEFVSEEKKASVTWLNGGTTVRGPGNDITESMKSKLVDFIDGRCPVIVQGDLYNVNSTVEKEYLLSQKMVDNTSNIFEFVNENNEREQVVKATNSKVDSIVMKYLSTARPIINATSIPKEYNGDANSSGYIDDSQYLSSRELLFTFTIDENTKGESSSNYRVNLYIDADRDGILDPDAKQSYPTNNGTYKPGEEIAISYAINDEIVGALPWKLEVVNSENNKIRTSISGFSAIKRKTSQKVDIYILQVNQNSTRNGSSAQSRWNLESDITPRENGNNTLFYTYTAKLNDYILHMETIDIQEFENRFNPEVRDGRAFDDSSEISRALTDQLTYQYDMIIFGFSDYYDNVSNEYGALDNVKYFLDCEHSVLFTHDVTSFNNDATDATVNSHDVRGYNFNVSFRDILGMDRFGARSTEEERESKDQATSELGNYTDIHGYTYEAIKRLGDASSNKYGLFKGMNFSFNNDYTTKVSKLNDGQITRYPYTINDTISVAKTHGQYYQLDMENEDIVVWYTLSGSNVYDVSPNDGANNYYIYSKGNIVYSGVGHSDVGSIEEEVKLFINTMVAAYRNGIKAPTITVTNEDSYVVNHNEYYVYVNDDNHSENTDSDYYDIEFTPYDSNMLTPEIRVQATTKDGFQLDIYDLDGNKMIPDKYGYVTLQSEYNYIAKWPKSYLSDEKKKEVNFIAINAKGVYGGSIVHVLRRGLFDLD